MIKDGAHQKLTRHDGGDGRGDANTRDHVADRADDNETKDASAKCIPWDIPPLCKFSSTVYQQRDQRDERPRGE